MDAEVINNIGLETEKGRVLETKKHYQSIGYGIPAILHYEIWVRTDNGMEKRIKLFDFDMPIRKGHLLAVIYKNEKEAAILNFTTEQYVNLCPIEKHKIKYSYLRVALSVISALVIAASFKGEVILGVIVPALIMYGGIFGTRDDKALRESKKLHDEIEEAAINLIQKAQS